MRPLPGILLQIWLYSTNAWNHRDKSLEIKDHMREHPQAQALLTCVVIEGQYAIWKSVYVLTLEAPESEALVMSFLHHEHFALIYSWYGILICTHKSYLFYGIDLYWAWQFHHGCTLFRRTISSTVFKKFLCVFWGLDLCWGLNLCNFFFLENWGLLLSEGVIAFPDTCWVFLLCCS